MNTNADTNMGSTKLKDFIKCGKKIFGAGLNYRSAISWAKLPTPTEPSIFMKPATSYVVEDDCILIPEGCIDVKEEVELGVIIGKKGRYVKEEDAYEHVGGYCLALDMTDAGFLVKGRSQGLPWTIGKGWDTSCPVSRFISKKELPNPQDVRIYAKVNCKYVQDSSTCDMLFTIPQLISYISGFMTIEPYDLILTGTPCGSTTVKPGDRIECGLGDIVAMDFDVKAEC